MDLDCLLLDGWQIKGAEAVDQGYGDNGAACFYGAFEGPCLEGQDLIALAAPGSFGEDDEISSFFYLSCHFFDDFHGGTDIRPVHGNPFQKADDLLDQYPLRCLFLDHNSQRLWTAFYDSKHVKKSLMVWKQDESVGLW